MYTDETGAGQPTIQLAERPVRPRPDMNEPTATHGSQRYIDPRTRGRELGPAGTSTTAPRSSTAGRETAGTCGT